MHRYLIYSNGSQECETSSRGLLKACGHLDVRQLCINLILHFTEKQFREEFGDEVEYPHDLLLVLVHRGTSEGDH